MNTKNEETEITGEKHNNLFTFTCLVMFLVCSSFYLLTPILPLFSHEKLFVTKGQVGFMMGSFSIGAIIVRPLVGYFLDSFQRKKLFGLMALLGYFCSTFSYALISNFSFMIVVRIFHGFCWGSISTMLYTYAAEITPNHKRASRYGIFGAMLILAMSLAPLLGDVIYQGSFRRLVFVACFFALLALIFFFFTEEWHYGGRKSSENFFVFLKGFVNAQIIPFLLISFLSSFSFSGLLSFILLYAKTYHIKEASLFFTVYAVFSFLSRCLQGFLLSRLHASRLLLLACSFAVGAFFSLSFFVNPISYFIAASFLGFSIATFFTLTIVMAMNLVSEAQRGRTNASIAFCADIGIMSGAYFLGKLADLLDYRSMYFVNSILFLMLGVYIVLVFTTPTCKALSIPLSKMERE